MLDHSCQSGSAPFADRGVDLYETPACAVTALLQVERLPIGIWEPAAGRGAIVDVLRNHGHDVIASDICDYGFKLHFACDFLAVTKAPPGVECILTNPPFRIIGQFITHALNLCPRVVALARLAFLESERRSAILDRGKLARVHVFKRRLPFMHRAGWDGPRASSAIPFAWFAFDCNHRGPTTIDRIPWTKADPPTSEWDAMWARPFERPELL